MKDDKISVIMPTYNVELYIDRAVKSIINQTYKNIELIIIDDCSSDRTKSICRKYQSEFKNIVLLEKNVNEGVSKCRNLRNREGIR